MNNEKKVRATAGAVIVKDGKMLLAKRNTEPFKDYWCLPGGHIDFGESAEEAIVREVKEETGLNFKPNFLGYIDEIIPEIDWHGVGLVFYGEAEGEESFDEEEIKELKWFDINEAANMKLAFKNAECVKMYLEKVGK
ncbi:NUDIX hydrolase [Candidatus Woesearchaeota archaeon]|nr:NUDIX hydrolase [Candidatus Woesearchaeota archaeon]